MIVVANVKLWGRLVGSIAWQADKGLGSFEFSPNFLESGFDVAPIKMPLSQGKNRIFQFEEHRNSHTFRGMPGLLADMLPDRYGNQLINTWLSRNGRATNSLNPIETLCFIGTRGMGALEIEPSIPKAGKQSQIIEIDELVQVAQNLLDGKINFTTDMPSKEEKALVDMLKIGTSAGGARAKAIIAYNQDSGEVRSGQTKVPEGFTYWLIKFDGVHDIQFGASSGYGRVEMAYHLMAKDAGINMMPCRLLEENGRAHFMTQRFDRGANNEKIHIQSFCAMEHFDFNEVGSYSYEQLFGTMRKLRLNYPEAQEMYRRMIFNIMSRNCDDHTKNFAFAMDKTGKWQLTPAYDICHAYRPGSEWVSQHALSINGKRQHQTTSDLLLVAKEMNIKNANRLIANCAEVVSNWPTYANKVNVEPSLREAIMATLRPLT